MKNTAGPNPGFTEEGLDDRPPDGSTAVDGDVEDLAEWKPKIP